MMMAMPEPGCVMMSHLDRVVMSRLDGVMMFHYGRVENSHLAQDQPVLQSLDRSHS